jgi:antitoxin (DNA-binding transcriptional repressor) of toxin-antitoxin stability system
MAYTVHQAKTHFSRLLKEAEAGQEVVVMCSKKPVAKIVAINKTPAEEPGRNFRLIGAFRGKIRWDENAFDPMTGPGTDREWAGVHAQRDAGSFTTGLTLRR